MELIFAVIVGLLLASVIAWIMAPDCNNEKTEVEVEKKRIPYIEADEDEKISREIDQFIKENNCYVPKK